MLNHQAANVTGRLAANVARKLASVNHTIVIAGDAGHIVCRTGERDVRPHIAVNDTATGLDGAHDAAKVARTGGTVDGARQHKHMLDGALQHRCDGATTQIQPQVSILGNDQILDHTTLTHIAKQAGILGLRQVVAHAEAPQRMAIAIEGAQEGGRLGQAHQPEVGVPLHVNVTSQLQAVAVKGETASVGRLAQTHHVGIVFYHVWVIGRATARKQGGIDRYLALVSHALQVRRQCHHLTLVATGDVHRGAIQGGLCTLAQHPAHAMAVAHRKVVLDLGVCVARSQEVGNGAQLRRRCIGVAAQARIEARLKQPYLGVQAVESLAAGELRSAQPALLRGVAHNLVVIVVALKHDVGRRQVIAQILAVAATGGHGIGQCAQAQAVGDGEVIDVGKLGHQATSLLDGGVAGLPHIGRVDQTGIIAVGDEALGPQSRTDRTDESSGATHRLQRPTIEAALDGATANLAGNASYIVAHAIARRALPLRHKIIL